jgi:hypothetical protein
MNKSYGAVRCSVVYWVEERFNGAIVYSVVKLVSESEECEAGRAINQVMRGAPTLDPSGRLSNMTLAPGRGDDAVPR